MFFLVGGSLIYFSFISFSKEGWVADLYPYHYSTCILRSMGSMLIQRRIWGYKPAPLIRNLIFSKHLIRCTRNLKSNLKFIIYVFTLSLILFLLQKFYISVFERINYFSWYFDLTNLWLHLQHGTYIRWYSEHNAYLRRKTGQE